MLKLIYLLLIFNITGILCAQEKGFVFTNNLRVRNEPSFNGKIVGKCSDNIVIESNGKKEIIYKNRVIYVYDKQGSGEYRGREWDYWYKISETENYWINGFYVAFFPMYFRYELYAWGHEYKIMDIDNDSHVSYYVLKSKQKDLNGQFMEAILPDNEIINKLIDCPYLRLSEFIKDINVKLNIYDNQEFDKVEFNRIFYQNIQNHSLLYGIDKIDDIYSICHILGNAHSGDPIGFFFDIVVDPDWSFDLIFLKASRTTVESISYTVTKRSQNTMEYIE